MAPELRTEPPESPTAAPDTPEILLLLDAGAGAAAASMHQLGAPATRGDDAQSGVADAAVTVTGAPLDDTSARGRSSGPTDPALTPLSTEPSDSPFSCGMMHQHSCDDSAKAPPRHLGTDGVTRPSPKPALEQVEEDETPGTRDGGDHHHRPARHKPGGVRKGWPRLAAAGGILHSCARAARSNPWGVVGLPLALFALLLGLVLWGMMSLRQNLLSRAHDRTLYQVDSAALWLQLSLKQALLPTLLMAQDVHNNPHFPASYQNFLSSARLSYSLLEDKSVVRYFNFIPMGWVWDVVPAATPDLQALLPLNDWPNDQASWLGYLATGSDFVMQGPQVSTVSSDRTTIILGAVSMVWFDDVSANETWGFPHDWEGGCEACYIPKTRSKLWGAIATSLFFDRLVDADSSQVTQLVQQGYKVRLYRYRVPQYDNVPGQLAVQGESWDPNIIPLFNSATTTGLPDPNSDATVTATVKLNYTNFGEWVMEVEPADGGVPWWWALSMCLLVVSVVLVGGLMFYAMVAYTLHRDILFKLVPETMVERMKTDDQFLRTAAGKRNGTAAEHLLAMLDKVTQSQDSDLAADAMFLRTTILSNQNIYAALDLKAELRNSQVEHEVGRYLLKELEGGAPGLLRGSSRWSSLPSGNDLHGSSMRGDVVVGSIRSQALKDISRRSGCNSPGGARPPAESEAELQAIEDWGPERPLSSELEAFLSDCSDAWTFDAYRLEELSEGHGLSVLGFHLLRTTGLMDAHKILPVRAARLLSAIEAGYHAHPYHNKRHAADVLRTMHVLLARSLRAGAANGYTTPITHLACLLAAAAHDLDHAGLTNDFLITTQHDLALTYNDDSPMEQHHAAGLFRLMKRPGLNILEHVPKPALHQFRATVIQLICATDMKRHVPLLSQFTSVHAATIRDAADAAAGVGLAPAAAAAPAPGPPPAALEPPPRAPLDATEQLLSLQIALKIADLGATAAALDVHVKWVRALEEEFFAQGDKEKLLDLPVSPLFDRDKPGVSKSQSGFYKFVTQPLLAAFCAVFPATCPMMEQMAANLAYWEQLYPPPAPASS